jgi:protein HIRA/HIR1
VIEILGLKTDVMDLAWSAKDQYLASCSVDNTVIIWNALKFPDIITRINAHAGLVKGVAWDPVGTYFASQSDDKTLKIWRTLDWSLEKCIDEPFKNCAGTTHVLRCNWSPDGQLVISAHAMNNGAPTAQVIDRGNKWNTKLDFVGHRKAVTAVVSFVLIFKFFFELFLPIVVVIK